VARRSTALLLACTLVLPSCVNAETFRIGRLSPNTAEADAPNLRAFREGLRDLGWNEGRDYVIEARFADGRFERLPAIAAELVRMNVGLLLAGSTAAARAAKSATASIPIVMVTTGDPVAAGLVGSLARPGGNLTGFTALSQDLNSKRLELIQEALPGVARVSVLLNPTSPDQSFMRDKDHASRALGLTLELLQASDLQEIDRAFATMGRARPSALMVVNDILFIAERKHVVALAASSRVPAIYGEREFVEAGGLMFYGASLVDLYRRAAEYAQKIAKGARPAELPIEQPKLFDLVVNVKAARALGITLPPALLSRAELVE
jgi:putative ABC transport system substrate-binding protein